MAISSLYIPLYTLDEVILDKDSGEPLAAGVVKFYRDSQRLTPKEVFTITGTPPDYSFASLGTELTLGLSGTFVDDDGNPIVVYAFPYDAAGEVDLYYVTVESSGGVDQFTREAVPYIPSATIPANLRTSNENEISNPQFVEVNFNPDVSTTTTLSLTGSGTVTNIAPNWDLVTTGTGTVQLNRLQPTASDLDTNPPYILSILADSGLGNTITLRQRLTNTPSIFRGKYISAQVLAKVISGGTSALSLVYAPSTGTSTTIINNESISSSDYEIITNAVMIDEQANGAAETGYVDINITIPTQRTIGITSIQIVGTAEEVDIPFDEQTAARQKDHLFHYYEDSILHQPKENLLVGWNFALNPWQFVATTSQNLGANAYIADQTIVIQQEGVQNNNWNNIASSRGTAAQNYAFVLTAVTATNKLAIIQYIDPSTIRPYWGENLSCRVNAKLVSPTHASTVRIKAKLLYRSSLPSTISRTEPIATWNATTNAFTYASGWTALTPLNDPSYTLLTSDASFDFNQFTLPASDNASMTLALMIYTIDEMTETATADAIHFNRVSLVQNDFAIDASVETFDECLRKCQFYYEKSYALGTLPGTITNENAKIIRANAPFESGGNSRLHAPTFSLTYMQAKRLAPTLYFYSNATGAVGVLSGEIVRDATNPTSTSSNPNDFSIAGATGWTVSAGIVSATLSSKDTQNQKMTVTVGNIGDEGLFTFHYVADSRLGI